MLYYVFYSVVQCYIIFTVLVAGDLRDVLESCFSIPKYFCIAQGDKYKMYGLNPSEVGLVGFWTFDDSIVLDSSGHSNHLDKKFSHGPSALGHGYSLHISSFNSLKIPLNNSTQIKNFTLSFWVYIISNTSLYFSNLISKGDYNSQTFTVMLYPDNRLSVRISTENNISEGIPSNSRLPKLRWTFVTAVDDSSLEIYINGILDNLLVLDSIPIANNGPLIIGPYTPSYQAYIDELKIYNHKLPSSYISSMANTALTGFAPNSHVVIGCNKCRFKETKRPGFCPDSYSLCTTEQMYLYAAHIARVNGWLVGKDQIWHSDTPQTDKTEERLSLCCTI